MLPDRPVFLHLLVDLLHERVGDGRRELLVVELAHDEVEPHLRGLVVDRRGRRDVDRVDDAAEPHLGETGAVVVHVDAAFGNTARRDVRLLRQHRRARAVGVVLLHLGDRVGAVHELEVRGVGAVLRHLLRDRADHVRRRVEVAPRGVTDLLDDGDLPLRVFARTGGTTRARSRCARRPGYVRTRALRFVRWLYGMFEHAPVPSNFQPWNGHVQRDRRRRCRRTRGARRGAGRTRPADGTHRSCRATTPARGPSTRPRSPRRVRDRSGTQPGTSRTGSGTGTDETPCRRF